MTRVGTFQFVQYHRIDEFHSRGWMVVGDLGPVHGRWSVLCWRCDCGVAS